MKYILIVLAVGLTNCSHFSKQPEEEVTPQTRNYPRAVFTQDQMSWMIKKRNYLESVMHDTAVSDETFYKLDAEIDSFLYTY